MPITVCWEDDSGKTIEDFAPASGPVLDEIFQYIDSQSSCLRFVDPYGHTVFNQLQLPELTAELRALQERLPDPALRTWVGELLAMIGRAEGQVHTYVRFVGD